MRSVSQVASVSYWRNSILALVCMVAAASGVHAQSSKPSVEVYGFAMADLIYDFKQNNPDWYDVNRPSRLPAFSGQFGRDGRTYISGRQSRLGAKGIFPTNHGPITGVFEFDLFGVGHDAGLTTIRPRHFYGTWGQFGAGQTNSVFMDVDVFPNTLEYWGPNGMLFFRNVQFWWRPVDNKNRFTIALENGGSSGDGGVLSDRIEIQNLSGRTPAPDFTTEYRWGTSWGYLELAGIARYIAYDDLLADAFDLNGHVWGWGFSFSSNYKPTRRDVIRFQTIYGAGIENYFNDAPIDVGPRLNPGNVITPIKGEALPAFGLSAYLDHNWNDRWSSAIGYSRVDIDNSDLQAADAYRDGQYASVNLLYSPNKAFLTGGEFLWANRRNNTDGFSIDDFRFQYSFKVSFNALIGGQ